MHIPQPSPSSAILPVGGIGAGLHHFAGVSWDVLMPYTILGTGLMVYSHFRLIRGQQVMQGREFAMTGPRQSNPSLETARQPLSGLKPPRLTDRLENLVIAWENIQ